MISQHKQSRQRKRLLWRNIKNSIENNQYSDRPLNYLKIRKYEAKKLKNYKYLKKLKYNIQMKYNHKYGISIELNENIDFEENTENIVSITKDVKNYIHNHLNLKFSINHKKIKDITSGGLLYLVGQISTITTAKYRDGKHHLKYNPLFGLPDDERIKYLFHAIGYWKYFEISTPYKINQTAIDTYFLSIEASNVADVNLLNRIKGFVNNNVNFIKNDYDIEYQFDDIIKEAMGNSIEHAYPKDFQELGKKKGQWWICGYYDKEDQTLEIAMYDYGVGIRKSMKYNLEEDAKIAFFDSVLDKLRSDADLIEMAINGDLSKYKKYKEEDRGKGFKKFKEFAKTIGCDCELTLVSNTGKYKMRYNFTNNKEYIEKTTLSSSIDGMIVKWKIYLKEGDLNE